MNDREINRYLKSPGMKNLKVCFPYTDHSDEDQVIDSLLPFRHDPIPEHHFDESEFSLRTSD